MISLCSAKLISALEKGLSCGKRIGGRMWGHKVLKHSKHQFIDSSTQTLDEHRARSGIWR